jgi:hypothetical protein
MILGIGLLVLRSDPPSAESWHPKCLLHRITGLHCPVCGSTRALHALAHGEWVAAARSNLLLTAGMPFFALAIWLRRRQAGRSAATRGLAWTLSALVLAFFIGRNVPSPNRSWLAPPTKTETTFENRSGGHG